MRFTHLFIDRPILATVLSVFLTLIGLGALVVLPVSQYPEIVPPTVQVTTSYPGASAQVVSQTVATPLEQQINGVEDMIYMSSQSTGDGNLTITVTFRVGTDLNVAQMLTQNRVQDALPRLPEDVQRLGVQVQKATPNILLAVHLFSPDGSRDNLYLSNYATLHVKDALARLPGVGNVQLFGARDYAMRIWLDPDKVAAYNLNAGEVLAALRAQNVQVSAGILNQPPISGDAAYQLNVQALGRLSTPEQFADIILKTDARGRATRIRDVGRVEIGAADYGSTAYMDRSEGLPLLIFALPGANSLKVEHEVLDTIQDLKKDFPPGVESIVIYDPTIFVAKSVREVVTTIFVAILLVVGVVFLFLQTWRASLIPVIAIPVSLDRHLHHPAHLRNIAEQPVAVRPGIGSRHRRRRRDRRRGERRAQHRRGHETKGGRPSNDGRSRRRACLHRADAVRRVRPLGLPVRHFGAVLPPVRRDHCRLDGDLAGCLAHAQPGALRAAAGRARSASGRQRESGRPGHSRRARLLQSRLRKTLGRLWLADQAPGARPGGRRGGLCRPDRCRRRGICPHANRVHSRAGPGIPDHCPAASSRRQPRANRAGGEAGDRYYAENARASSTSRRSPASTRRRSRSRPIQGRSFPACRRSTTIPSRGSRRTRCWPICASGCR